MVRAPCCEKMGLKKGPWSPEEDQILISFVRKYGHRNWRALPKQAGLLRCGKSCRLRWINYLCPDIKRGNFTIEEEETIIKLHEMLGNRWSAIAAKLPGRTDNEIKNVWHTHLKKRLNKNGRVANKNHKSMNKKDCPEKRHPTCSSSTGSTNVTDQLEPTPSFLSPQPSSSCFSSVTEPTSFGAEELARNDNDNYIVVIKDEKNEEHEFLGNINFAKIDESFMSEALPVEISNNTTSSLFGFSYPFSPRTSINSASNYDASNSLGHDMDFWYDIFIKAGGQSPELPEF